MSRPAAAALGLIAAATACGGPEAPADAAPAGAADGGPALEEAAPESAGCGDPGVLCYELGPVEVPAGTEWQGFEAFEVGNEEELAIVGIEIDQPGTVSHHFTVALWANEEPPPSGGPYELFSPEGLSFVGATLSNALLGSVYRRVRIDTGRYIGVPLPPRAFLVSNAHYFNTTPDDDHGHTTVLIRTVPREQVRFQSINALPGADDPIHVPPGETRTVRGTWTPPEDVAVLLMTSHMHRHGELFEVWKTVDGVKTQVYSTTSYEAPPLKIFATDGEPPLVLRPGRGDALTFECTHTNHDLDVPITYGPLADTDEMCIMPIYYSPEPDALIKLTELADDAGFQWEYEPY